MNNKFTYKGYSAKVEYDYDSLCLHGSIEGIDDLIVFSSKDARGIKKEFEKSVDEYLEFCKIAKKEPQKSYSGSFNVRISPDNHKTLYLISKEDGISLNAEIEKAVQYYIRNHDNSLKLDLVNKDIYGMFFSDSQSSFPDYDSMLVKTKNDWEQVFNGYISNQGANR
jgi:predicted HicB family RNase H-like nuclease